MRMLSASLASLLLLTPGANAQDAVTPASEEPTPATETSPDVAQAEGQPTAEAAPEGPQVGETYIRETVSDWSVRCLRAPIGQTDPCQMFQILREAAGNPAAEISVTRLAQEDGEFIAKMDILVPLETYLPPGVALSVDGRNAGRVPLLLCNSSRCLTEVPLKNGDVTAFKRGNEATVTIFAASAPDVAVPLTLSLSGFTAGFDGLAAN